jgi:hypothetical protein
VGRIESLSIRASLRKDSAGGHTWLNWRDYLTAFAPQLFQ